MDGDRLDGRSERRVARRREGVVQDVLRARPTRCSSSPATSSADDVQPARGEVLRRHPRRARRHQAPGVDRQDERRASSGDAGPRAPGAALQGLERSRVRDIRTRPTSSMALDILGSGKTSRLYKRLVYKDRIASDVAAFVDEREIASQLRLVATAQPGGDLAAVERVHGRGAAGVPRERPDARRARAREDAATRGVRPRRRAHRRLRRQVRRARARHGAPRRSRRPTRPSRRASRARRADDLRSAMQALDDGRRVRAGGASVPRVRGRRVERRPQEAASDAAPPPAAPLPAAERATLSNGMKVVLVARTAVPVVRLALNIDGGYAADDPAQAGRRWQ